MSSEPSQPQAEDRPPDPPGVPGSDGVEFPCEECGAAMTWDPDLDALGCAYCGSSRPVPRTEAAILERGLGEVDSAARGLGVELRVTACETCGARVTFEGRTTSERCVFCGSPSVLSQEANRSALRPESLLPLDVGRRQVEEHFERWRSSLWFRPNALRRVSLSSAVGIYVPFWTFDACVHSSWSADSGTYYHVPVTETVMVNGKPSIRTRMERRTRWRPAWGERSDTYDDELVLASAGQPADLVRELGAFSLQGLVAYQPHYLAGWRAEEYSVDLEEGWSQARRRIVERQETRCAGDVPGDTHRFLRVSNHIDGVRWKQVLLPIWSLQYRLGARTYTVLVHGQSGRIVGRAPYSWRKILFGVLGLFLTIAFVVALSIGAVHLGHATGFLD
jgi:DNA-directed RNA polymerase subunit RPC12/RpoP